MWNVELFDRLISDTAAQSDSINSSSSGTIQDSVPEITTSKIGPLIWANMQDSQLFVEDISENVQTNVDQPVSSIIVDQDTINEVTMEDSEKRPSRNCMKAGSSGKKLSAVQLFQELCGNKGNPSLNPHSLIAPFAYGDPIGPAPTEKQPFSIVIHPQVGLICDFHAHLSDAEVIGLLAGKYDEEKKSLYIQAPFPCTAVDRLDDDGSTDVELDPEAEWKARETISNLDMEVVGWYHSHPRFRPDPSLTDVFNQEQHQCMDHDNTTFIKPFVGLIVSTFDPSLTTYASHHQWFHVRSYTSAGSKRSVYMPMLLNVAYATLSSTTVSSKSIEYLEEKFDSIVSKSADEPSDNKVVVESQTVGEISHPPAASDESAPMDEVKSEPNKEPSELGPIQNGPSSTTTTTTTTHDGVEMEVLDNTAVAATKPIKSQKPRKRVPAGNTIGRQRTQPSKIVDNQSQKESELLVESAEDPSLSLSLDRRELVHRTILKSENPVSVTDIGESYHDSVLDDSSRNITITAAAILEDVTRPVEGVANECKESETALESDDTLVILQPSDDIAMAVVDSEHKQEIVVVSVESFFPETAADVVTIPVESSTNTHNEDDNVLELPSSDVLDVLVPDIASGESFENTDTVIESAESAIASMDNNVELSAEALATNGISIKSESQTTALKKPRKKIPVPVEEVVERSKRTVKAREIYDDSVYRKRKKQSSDAQEMSILSTTIASEEALPVKRKYRPRKSLTKTDTVVEADVPIVDQSELPEQNSNSVSIVETSAILPSERLELNVKEETEHISEIGQQKLPAQSTGETATSDTLDIVESSISSAMESSIVDQQEQTDPDRNIKSVVDSSNLAVSSEALDVAMKEECSSSSATESFIVDQQELPLVQNGTSDIAVDSALAVSNESVDIAVEEESEKEAAVVDRSNCASSSSETLDKAAKEDESSNSSSVKDSSNIVDQQGLPDQSSNGEMAEDSVLAVSSQVTVKEENEKEPTAVDKQDLPDQSNNANASSETLEVVVKEEGKRKERTKKVESNKDTASSRERRQLVKKTFDDFDTGIDIVKKRTHSSAKKQPKSAIKSKSDKSDEDELLKVDDTHDEQPAVPTRRGKAKQSVAQSEEESDSGKPSRKGKVYRKKQTISKMSSKKSKKNGLAHSHDDDDGEPKPKKKALALKKIRATDSSALESSFNVDVISLLKDRSQPFTPHGRKVLFSVAPEYRYLTLCIISLGCYYRQSKYKVDLMRKWKDHTKLEKLRVSATVWAKYLGLAVISTASTGPPPSAPSETTTGNGIQADAGEEGDGSGTVVKRKGKGKSVVRTRSALSSSSSSDDGAATVRLIPELVEFLRLCWEPPPSAPHSATAAATGATKEGGKKKKRAAPASSAGTDGESTKKKKKKPSSSAGKTRAD